MGDLWEHGVVGTYTNHKCRCDACRAAHGEYQARRKAERKAALAADPDLAVHGLATTYSNWSCRCPRCAAAWKAACAERAQRRRS